MSNSISTSKIYGNTNPSNGTPFNFQCPKDKWITKIKGRSSSKLDQLCIACGNNNSSNAYKCFGSSQNGTIFSEEYPDSDQGFGGANIRSGS